jgi:hypothetical protein
MPERESENCEGVLEALEEMSAALREVSRRTEMMVAQAELVAALRREGGAWEDILFRDGTRRLTRMLADSTCALSRANSAVRHAQADTLYRRGVTMGRIGRLLGISRQRVAVLLRAVRD